MTEHPARCRCGALTAIARGEPVRVSVCHCLDCQQRSGSAFSAQVRFPSADVTIAGPSRVWERVGESGRWARFRFCPECGGEIAYEIELLPGLTAIPLGVFDDPHAFRPSFSVWESRRHDWLTIGGEVERG